MRYCAICSNKATECTCGFCPEGDRPPGDGDDWKPATVSVDALLILSVGAFLVGWAVGRYMAGGW